ncbi:hypothetical protein LCGC14_2593860, partial [marine sediment metagenome]
INATAQKFGNFVILNEEVDLFNFPEQFAKILEVIGIMPVRASTFCSEMLLRTT